MRFLSITALLLLAPFAPLSADQLRPCVIKWPDPEVRVPERIRQFIEFECRKYDGLTGESLRDCVRGESYGYRAVAGMLSDPATGEIAAKRYRACAAGLGDFGGRFHRRKAECIGSAFRYVWRFEFSQHASAGGGDAAFEVASRAR